MFESGRSRNGTSLYPIRLLVFFFFIRHRKCPHYNRNLVLAELVIINPFCHMFTRKGKWDRQDLLVKSGSLLLASSLSRGFPVFESTSILFWFYFRIIIAMLYHGDVCFVLSELVVSLCNIIIILHVNITNFLNKI